MLTGIVGVTDGKTPSGGSSPKLFNNNNISNIPHSNIQQDSIFEDLDKQIEKSIKSATAKLEVLKSKTVTLAAIVEDNNSLFVNNNIVEQQLLYKWLEDSHKSNIHRQKLDLLPISFMGLVTKILNKR